MVTSVCYLFVFQSSNSFKGKDSEVFVFEESNNHKVLRHI